MDGWMDGLEELFSCERKDGCVRSFSPPSLFLPLSPGIVATIPREVETRENLRIRCRVRGVFDK